MSFSGTLGADGAVTLTADTTKGTGGGTCDATSKTGCTVAPTSATAPDIDVLAAAVFPGDLGYDLTIDLNGADTYDIATAEFTITESNEVTTCTTKAGGCTTTGTSTTTTAEVVWDDIRTVWEGVNALALDEDPMTSMAMVVRIDGTDNATRTNEAGYGLAIVSDGWTTTTAPASATIELDGGETITIPANSYQVAASEEFTPTWGDVTEFSVTMDGNPVAARFTLTRPGVYQLDAEIDGRFGMLTEGDDGTWTLSATAYSERSTDLPSGTSLTITPMEKLGAYPEFSESFALTYTDEVAVVFANEVSFAGDPVGVGVSGTVSLLGVKDNSGKQKTLSKGSFYSSFVHVEGGSMIFGGADKHDIDAKGDILIGGESIDFERTDTNKDGVIDAPPVIVMRTRPPGFSGFGQGWARITMLHAL